MANKLLKILEVKFDENLTPKQVNIGTATQTSERLFKLHVVVPNIDLQKDSCYVACELPVKKRYTNKTSKIKLPYNLNSQFEFYKTIDGIDYYHTYIDLDSRVLKYVGDIKLNVVIEHLTGEIVAIDYEDNESEYNQMEIVDTRSSETFTISVMRSSNYNENLYPEDEDEYDEAVVHIDAILKFLAAYQSYAPAKKDTLQVLDSKPSDISNLNGLYFFKDKNEVDFIKNGKVEQVIFEDQFLEFDSKNAFPIKGDYGRLYLDKSNNLLYVWNVELEKYLEILPLILKNNFKIEDGKITFYNSDSNEQYARVILSDDQIELRTRLDGEKARSFILNNDGLFLDQNKIATLDDISKLVNGAPETLNTLKELSDALNNDANFATNVLKLINNLENKKYDKTGGRISGYVDVDEINSKSGHFKVGRINNSEADTIDEDVVDTLEILGTQTFEYSPNDSFLNWNGNTVSTATGQIISDSNWQFEKDGIVGRGSSLICKDSYYRLQSSQWSPYHAYKFTFRALTTGRAKISLRILCNGYEIAYYKEGSNSENNSFSSLIRSDNVWKDFSVQLDQPVHGIITFEFRSNNDADSAKAIYIARLEILEAKGVSNKPNATFIDFQDDEVVSYYYGNLRYRYNSILNNVITNEKFTVLFDNSHEESFSKDTMFKIDKAEGDMTYKSRAYRVIYLNNGSYYTDSWIDTRHVETDPEQWQTRHDNGFKIYNEGEFEVAAWCLPNGIVPDSDDHLTPKIAQPLAGLRLSNDTSRFITYEGGTDVGSQYCGTKADPEEEDNFSFHRYADKGENINAGLRTSEYLGDVNVASDMTDNQSSDGVSKPVIDTEVFASPVYSNRKFYINKNVYIGNDSNGISMYRWSAHTYALPKDEFALLKVYFTTEEPDTTVYFNCTYNADEVSVSISELDIDLEGNINDIAVNEGTSITVETPGRHYIYLSVYNVSDSDLKHGRFEIFNYSLNEEDGELGYFEKGDLENAGYVRLPRVGMGIARVDGEVQRNLDNDLMCIFFRPNGIVDIRNTISKIKNYKFLGKTKYKYDSDGNLVNEPDYDDFGKVRFISDGVVFRDNNNSYTVLDIDAKTGKIDLKGSATLNSKTIATLDDITHSIAALVNSSPTTLDTLNELANALGNNPNFATTITNEIGKKADKTEINLMKQTFETDNINTNSEISNIKNRVGNLEPKVVTIENALNEKLDKQIEWDYDEDSNPETPSKKLGIKFSKSNECGNLKVRDESGNYLTVVQLNALFRELLLKDLSKISLKDIEKLSINNINQFLANLTGNVDFKVNYGVDKGRIFSDGYTTTFYSSYNTNVFSKENVRIWGQSKVYAEAGEDFELRIGETFNVTDYGLDSNQNYIAKIGMYKERTFNGITGSMIQIGGSSKGENLEGTYLDLLVLDRVNHIVIDMMNDAIKTDFKIEVDEFNLNNGSFVVPGNRPRDGVAIPGPSGTRNGVNTYNDFYKYGVEKGLFEQAEDLKAENTALKARVSTLESTIQLLSAKIEALENKNGGNE